MTCSNTTERLDERLIYKGDILRQTLRETMLNCFTSLLYMQCFTEICIHILTSELSFGFKKSYWLSLNVSHVLEIWQLLKVCAFLAPAYCFSLTFIRSSLKQRINQITQNILQDFIQRKHWGLIHTPLTFYISWCQTFLQTYTSLDRNKNLRQNGMRSK